MRHIMRRGGVPARKLGDPKAAQFVEREKAVWNVEIALPGTAAD